MPMSAPRLCNAALKNGLGRDFAKTWATAAFLMAVNALWRRASLRGERTVIGATQLGGVALGAWLGWTSSRKYDLQPIESGALGALLSTAGAWALPLFHARDERHRLAFANAVFLGGVAFLAGVIGRRVEHTGTVGS